MAILDAAMGLIPLRTPLESETVKLTTASTVYPGEPGILNTGAVIPYDTGLTCLGCILDYAVSGEEATVCVAADMHYRVKGNSNFTTSDIGKYCAFVDPDAANTTTLRSAAVANTTSASSTASGDMCLQIVGEYQVVTPEAEAQWFEVRIHTGEIS